MKRSSLLWLFPLSPILALAQITTTHYIGPNGDDTADGLSPAKAWLSPNHAGLTCGVDEIVALSGDYGSNLPYQFSGTWGAVTCSKANDVVWVKCETPFACKWKSPTSGWIITAPYWGVQGWEFDNSERGVSANTLNGQPPLHHIIIANNIINGAVNGGIGIGADYVADIGNLTYNSAAGSQYACPSGHSIGLNLTYDQAVGTHILVAGNVNVANVNSPTCGANTNGDGNAPTNSDGNGIIFDTVNRSGYVQVMYAVNNLNIGNGGRGMEVYQSDAPIFMRHNTNYHNTVDSSQNTAQPPDQCGETWLVSASHARVAEDVDVPLDSSQASACKPSPMGISVEHTNGISVSHTWLYSSAGNNLYDYDNHDASGNAFSFGPALYQNQSPAFVNPQIPTAPWSCAGFATTRECAATIWAGFMPTNADAKRFGIQLYNPDGNTDRYYPQWLCSVTDLPAVITPGCL